MVDEQTIVRTLVRRRRSLGLKQWELAQRVGVGQQQISRWEQGQQVTLAALRDYADAVGLSLELSLEPKRR